MLAGHKDFAKALVEGCGVTRFGQMHENILAQGGYAPTPASATTGDRAFMV